MTQTTDEGLCSVTVLYCRYNSVAGWDAGATCALAQWYSEIGDAQTAKHHYQDVSISAALDILRQLLS